MKLPTVALLALVGALPRSLASLCGEGSSRIFCENGGLCRSGRADFSMYQLEDGSYHDVHNLDNDQVYCECDPDAWTGIDCSVPVENCADGGHFCLYVEKVGGDHGGNCIADGSTESLYCDCSAALDEDGNRYGTFAVGQWCEHQELNHCDPDGDRHTFCLHGGVCNPEFPLNGPPCKCESGFDGPHCEYQVENALPDCTLDCQNGGVCKLGLGVGLVDEYNYFQSDNDTTEDYMYCDCPPGRHGPLCQVDSILCGDDRCYNGGVCMTREFEGKTISHCNCNTAGDKDTRFAGKFCQYPSTEICTNSGSLEGKLFCVNGGRCQPDPYLGCNCDEGFDGFACEFRISTGDDDADDYYDDDADDYYDGDDGGNPVTQPIAPGFDLPEEAHCELQCNGHGTCRKGIKDITSLGIAAHGNYLNETHTDEFEHCVCDHGFVGLQCEHEVQICGDNDEEPEHFCLHGGSCIRIEEEGFVCDCSTASGDLGEIFFGGHCQHPATSCVEPADPNGSFCANGGVCIENAESDKT
eukprot:scaffold1361_cov165-Amphora_coffeaeformis.AAC.16